MDFASDRAHGGSYALIVNGTPVHGLYPGRTQQISLTLSNPFPFPLQVTRVRGEVVGSSRKECVTDLTNVVVRTYTGRLPQSLRPRQTKAVGNLSIYMPATASRGCASTIFKVRLVGSATRLER